MTARTGGRISRAERPTGNTLRLLSWTTRLQNEHVALLVESLIRDAWRSEAKSVGAMVSLARVFEDGCEYFKSNTTVGGLPTHLARIQHIDSMHYDIPGRAHPARSTAVEVLARHGCDIGYRGAR